MSSEKIPQAHDSSVPLDDEAFAVVQRALAAPAYLSPYAAIYYPKRTWSAIVKDTRLTPAEKHHLLVGILRVVLQRNPKTEPLASITALLDIHPAAKPFFT